MLRSQLKRAETEAKGAKVRYAADILTLQEELTTERQRRLNLNESKIDKNNVLLKQLVEKDSKIMHLTK